MHDCKVHTSNKLDHPMEFIETQVERVGKWNKGVMYYNVENSCRTMSDRDVRRALNYTMTTWAIEIPILFKQAWAHGVTPDIRLEFKSALEDKLFADSPSVLAYAYFPEQGSVSGKVVFNSEYIWDFQGKGIKASDAVAKGWIVGTSNPNNIIKTYSLIAVLIHEIGHSLGLTHDASGNTSGVDVMDAYYSGTDRFELSVRDIARIVLKYGVRIYSQFNGYNRLKKAIEKGKLRL